MSDGDDRLQPPAGATRRRVRAELGIERRPVLLVVVVTLLSAASVVAGPVLIQTAIDDGIVAADRAALGWAVGGYLVVVAAGGVCNGVRSSVMTAAAERVVHRLRVDSLAGLLRLDLGRFERTPRGDLLARVTTDAESLAESARWVLPDAVRFSVDLVAALVALAVLDPVLAGLALMAVPPMAIAGGVLRRRSRIVYPRFRESLASVVGQITETVEATDVVRAHGRSADRLALLEAANAQATARFLDGTSMRNRFYASLTITRVASTAIILVCASLLAERGTLSVGTAAAGVLAVGTVFGPLAWLTELLDDILSARAALDRVVAAAAVEHDGSGSSSLSDRGDLELDGVSFAYVVGRPVLAGFDLHVAAGERVALVGPTGAGKSTVGRLAVGLAEPQEGTVRVAGTDLRDVAPDARRRLVFVTQEPWCLAGSLGDDLRLVRAGAADDELYAAADLLGLRDWVDGHPDGLRRQIGSSGSALSAGERQLVALLRVVLADPTVVVLDEATAVLDEVTEQLVATALDRALEGRTVLVIAHREATAARADRQVHLAGTA